LYIIIYIAVEYGGALMTTTRRMRVNRWGNSLGIRFPAEFTDYTHITDKSIVDVSIEEDKIIITKATEKRPYKSIQELFEGFDGEYEPVEIDWGKPVGNEVW
jgi:antitoxin MazE